MKFVLSTETIMGSAAAAASHERVETSILDRGATRVGISATGRATLTRFAWLVVAYNIAVIVWGAYVRATGSGAGCGRHWPLCNGEVLPATPQTQTVIEFTHRVSSGLSLVLVLILLIWCWRRTARGEWARYSAVSATVLLLNEALLGALLVLVDRFGGLEQPTAHAFFLCVHFGNTLLLLAALALTARWLSPSGRRLEWTATPYQTIAIGFGVVSIIIIGMTGSLASLGDAIFRVDSLRHAVLLDFSSTAPTLLRLRILHPVAAVIGSIYILWLLQAFWRKRDRSAWVPLLPIVLTVQIALGAMNVILLAPVWLQMTHLLVAEIFWIVVVLASADRLFAAQHSNLLLSRNANTATAWSLGFKTADHIRRRGELVS